MSLVIPPSRTGSITTMEQKYENSSGLLLVLSSYANAYEVKTTKETPKGTVQDIVKETKTTTRQNKVEMCHECGKPEAECDCEGEENKPKK
jgi:hypothetical protein